MEPGRYPAWTYKVTDALLWLLTDESKYSSFLPFHLGVVPSLFKFYPLVHRLSSVSVSLRLVYSCLVLSLFVFTHTYISLVYSFLSVVSFTLSGKPAYICFPVSTHKLQTTSHWQSFGIYLPPAQTYHTQRRQSILRQDRHHVLPNSRALLGMQMPLLSTRSRQVRCVWPARPWHPKADDISRICL